MKRLLKKLYLAVPGKKYLFSLLKIIWLPPAFIYQHLYFRGAFKARVGGLSFKMMHYGHLLENKLFWEDFESQTLEVWSKLAEESSVVLDIGANTGPYALVAKAANSRAQVFAFEPFHGAYEKLVKNCELNDFDITSLEL